jgi:leucyl/phenylalanyl-tRNA--protein transferase
MTIYLLDERLGFPDPRRTDPSGILAVGGDLSPERLLLAYSMGVFPWFNEGDPILWHCPAWRLVLRPDEIHVGRTMRKVIKRADYEVRYDTAFDEVIAACARTPRPGQEGTWITADMAAAYRRLFRLGYAHSCEAWRDGRLWGGLYGVTLGGMFFGESMFSHRDNASKCAFITLVGALRSLGYALVDCQVYTEHLATFGAVEWPRDRFLSALGQALTVQPRRAWPDGSESLNEPQAG